MSDIKNVELVQLKSRDLFLASTILVLDMIKDCGKDVSELLKNNTTKLRTAFLNDNVEGDSIGIMMKKAFTVMSKNIDNLVKHNSALFKIVDNKDGKQIKVTIISGIDLEEAYELLDYKVKPIFWKYLTGIYVAASRLILTVKDKNTFDKKLIDSITDMSMTVSGADILEEFHLKYLNNKIIKRDAINPFIGIAGAGTLSVNDLKSKDNTKIEAPGLGSMVKMIGLDNVMGGMGGMGNMNDMLGQLKNINQDEINAATANITKMMGNNIDAQTSNMVNMMVNGIVDKLKTGEGMPNMMQLAEDVAKDTMKKIDPKSINQESLLKSAEAMANSMRDPCGNKIMGGNNPLSFLMSMMSKQATGKKPSEKELNELKQINSKLMGDMAKSGMNPAMLQNLLGKK